MSKLPKTCPDRCDALEKQLAERDEQYRVVRRQLYMALGQLQLWVIEGQSPHQASLACHRDITRLLQQTPYIGEPKVAPHLYVGVESDAEVASAVGLVQRGVTDEMVNRFLQWPLPKSVCSDTCVSMNDYQFPRFGTSLLTAVEARQMLEHVLGSTSDGDADGR